MAFVVRQPHSSLNEAEIMEFVARQVLPIQLLTWVFQFHIYVIMLYYNL